MLKSERIYFKYIVFAISVCENNYLKDSIIKNFSKEQLLHFKN